MENQYIYIPESPNDDDEGDDDNIYPEDLGDESDDENSEDIDDNTKPRKNVKNNIDGEEGENILSELSFLKTKSKITNEVAKLSSALGKILSHGFEQNNIKMDMYRRRCLRLQKRNLKLKQRCLQYQKLNHKLLQDINDVIIVNQKMNKIRKQTDE